MGTFIFNKHQWPNALTVFRMLLAIPILILMRDQEMPFRIAATAVFLLASITDYFDGMLARKYNCSTTFGKLMDPVADKVLISCVLIALVPTREVDPYVVVLLITRDLLIGGLRSIAAHDNVMIAAKPTGKWKTALQMIAIPALLLGFNQLGLIFIWVSVVLSLISAVEYVKLYLSSSPRKPRRARPK